MRVAQKIRAVKGQRRNHEARPGRRRALTGFVRPSGTGNLGEDGGQIRHRRQPADFDHAHLAALEDGRQPHHKAVDAQAPEEIDRRQDQHARHFKCGEIVFDRRYILLLFGQLRFQRLALGIGQPFGASRAVGHHLPPHDAPQHRRQAFDDEHFAPAEILDQVARQHRHPQHGDGIAQHQKGVGAGAFLAGVPARLQNQHRRQHRAFHDAQREAHAIERVEIVQQASDGGEQTPADQAPQDQLLDAVFLRVGGAGNLEHEIAQEEQRAQQRVFRSGDSKILGHAAGGSEAEIGAIEIGQAVGDENHRQQKRPAAAQGSPPNIVKGQASMSDVLIQTEHGQKNEQGSKI